MRPSTGPRHRPSATATVTAIATVVATAAATAVFAVVASAPANAATCQALPGSLPAAGSLPAVSELPDPFKLYGGGRLASSAGWACRRAQLKELIQYYEFGHLPTAATTTTGTRSGKNLTVNASSGGASASFAVTVNLPSGASSSSPVPAIIAANSITGNLTSRGYAIVNLNLPGVAADSTAKTGAFWKLYPNSDAGVLMAWAWGFHRVLDALKAVPEIDTTKVAVTGFSRYGKAALVAGAFDERIALTIPSSSGPGGMANFRFYYSMGSYSEKFENILEAAYWFTPRFSTFRGQVTRLPFDAHSVAALVAPRALLTTNGTEDPYTNPKGTSHTHRAAKMVYQYIGAADRIGINFRPGTHAASEEDGKAIGDFADKHLKGKTVSRSFDNDPYPNNTTAIPWTMPSGAGVPPPGIGTATATRTTTVTPSAPARP